MPVIFWDCKSINWTECKMNALYMGHRYYHYVEHLIISMGFFFRPKQKNFAKPLKLNVWFFWKFLLQLNTVTKTFKKYCNFGRKTGQTVFMWSIDKNQRHWELVVYCGHRLLLLKSRRYHRRHRPLSHGSTRPLSGLCRRPTSSSLRWWRITTQRAVRSRSRSWMTGTMTGMMTTTTTPAPLMHKYTALAWLL